MHAAVWMFGAVASFSLMAVSGREASRDLATPDVLFYRGLISLVIVAAIIQLSGKPWSHFQSRRPGLQILRAGSHFVGQATWLMAVTMIPLSQVFALEFTSPIWVALIAPFVLGERLTALRILAAAIGFAGVLVVVRPGFTVVGPGTLLAMTCALFFALSIVTTKLLTRTDGPLTILLYMMVIQSLIAFAITLATPGWPQPIAWAWLALLGTASLTAHFCLVKAFEIADTLVVAPMDFIRLPLITVVGFLAYDEALDLFVILGGAIIVAGNLLNVLGERRLSQILGKS